MMSHCCLEHFILVSSFSLQPPHGCILLIKDHGTGVAYKSLLFKFAINNYNIPVIYHHNLSLLWKLFHFILIVRYTALYQLIPINGLEILSTHYYFVWHKIFHNDSYFSLIVTLEYLALYRVITPGSLNANKESVVHWQCCKHLFGHQQQP